MFLNELDVRHLGGKWWKLLTPLSYYSERLDAIITVPAGFVCDMASVPRVPVAYWLFGGRANRPAVIHDFLYRWGSLPRIEADLVFMEAMRADGKLPHTRAIMAGFCMAAGWAVYDPRPGCLDRRGCLVGECFKQCKKYLPDWKGIREVEEVRH